MESLALIASIIILGRIAYVALCIALVITYLNHRFVDGFLQARPGLPPNPLFYFGLGAAGLGMIFHAMIFWFH